MKYKRTCSVPRSSSNSNWTSNSKATRRGKKLTRRLTQLKSTENYLKKITSILTRNKSPPELFNSYIYSRKNANWIEWKQNITIVVQWKENKIKSLRSYLTINRNANSGSYSADWGSSVIILSLQMTIFSVLFTWNSVTSEKGFEFQDFLMSKKCSLNIPYSWETRIT